MQPEITDFKKWVMVDGTVGIQWYPGQYFTMGQAVEDYPGKVEDVKLWRGYGARLSMPGYTDCTEWTVYDSKHEAAADILAMYFDYPDEELTDIDQGWRDMLEEVEAGDA